MARTIHDLSETEAQIFHENEELTLGEIDEDPNEEIPIFAVVLNDGAFCTFCFPYEEDMLRVLHVENGETDDGEMKRMLDFITQRFGIYGVEFFNVTNKELINKLNNPSTKTIEVETSRHDVPQKVLIARVVWE